MQEAAEELAGEPAVRKKGKKKRKDASDFLQHLAAMETEAQPGPSTAEISGEMNFIPAYTAGEPFGVAHRSSLHSNAHRRWLS